MRWRIVLLLLGLGYLATGIAQVRPEERAVVRRFGRVVARPGPGLWIGFPWGIDQIDRIPVRTVRQLEIGAIPDPRDEVSPSQYLTGDQNLVDIKLVVEYAIDEREGELDRYAQQYEVVDDLLRREVESLVGEWMAARGVDEVLLTGRGALPYWAMEQLSTRIAALQLGIMVQRLSIDYLSPPIRVGDVLVRDAFDEVNQAQAGIQTRENLARQEGARRLREAEAIRFRSEQQSAAYRAETLGAAKAEATLFLTRLEQYRKARSTNPDALTALWWDEMGRTLLGMKGRGRIDLLDSRLGADGLDINQYLPPRKK